jgi:hypothetical protein
VLVRAMARGDADLAQVRQLALQRGDVVDLLA